MSVLDALLFRLSSHSTMNSPVLFPTAGFCCRFASVEMARPAGSSTTPAVLTRAP